MYERRHLHRTPTTSGGDGCPPTTLESCHANPNPRLLAGAAAAALLALPAAGEARVTARHAAVTPLTSEDPDILVNGDAAATDVTNPMEFSTDVPAAAHDLAVNLAGTDTTVLSADGVELAEGTSTIVYAIGSAADDTLGLLVQSIGGLGSAPEGVPAGNAGLADGSRSGCSVPRAASRCRSVCSRPTAGAPWRRGSISPHAACWTSRSSRTTATPPTAATACCAAT